MEKAKQYIEYKIAFFEAQLDSTSGIQENDNLDNFRLNIQINELRDILNFINTNENEVSNNQSNG